MTVGKSILGKLLYGSLPLFHTLDDKQQYILYVYDLFKQETNAAGGSEFMYKEGYDFAYSQFLERVHSAPLVISSSPEQEQVIFERDDYYFYILTTAVCGFIMGMGVAAAMWGSLCGA